MRRVAIVSPVRTAVGNFGGTLKDIPAEELACTVIKETLERSKLDPAKVDDVILGHGYPSGENPAIGRLALLKAGLPIEVPGYQLDRRCSSGLQAILNACMMVQTENADVVIAGGVESMSNAEYYVNESRWGARFGSVTLHDRLARARETISPEDRFGYISGMVETAENLAKQYEISREEQDEYSLRSHKRAVAAQEAGKFDSQIVPIEIPQRRGDPVIFDKDEGPRGDSSMEVLGRLRPVMKDGSVSAGKLPRGLVPVPSALALSPLWMTKSGTTRCTITSVQYGSAAGSTSPSSSNPVVDRVINCSVLIGRRPSNSSKMMSPTSIS